jgi:hypothetical protein
MSRVFNNMSRTSGTTVLAASEGNSTATLNLGVAANNGVITQAILNRMASGEPTTVNELTAYIIAYAAQYDPLGLGIGPKKLPRVRFEK